VTKKVLDNKVASVLKETKNELVSIIDKYKSQNEAPIEMSVQDLGTWFGHVITTNEKENRNKNELKFESIKEMHFEKFEEQVEHQLEKYDCNGIISLLARKTVSRDFPQQISGPSSGPKHKENTEVGTSSISQCSQCRQGVQCTKNTLNESEFWLFDTFVELNAITLCTTCYWNLDPSLFENASAKFKAAIVSTFQ
jgi:hypothetical protein